MNPVLAPIQLLEFFQPFYGSFLTQPKAVANIISRGAELEVRFVKGSQNAGGQAMCFKFILSGGS